MKYFVIGDEDDVLGFRMVGVEGVLGRNQEEVDGAFTRAVNDKEVGVVLITERSADFIREKVNEYVFTQAFPLICEIPDRTGRNPDRPPLRDLANEAIGIKI